MSSSTNAAATTHTAHRRAWMMTLVLIMVAAGCVLTRGTMTRRLTAPVDTRRHLKGYWDNLTPMYPPGEAPPPASAPPPEPEAPPETNVAPPAPTLVQDDDQDGFCSTQGCQGLALGVAVTLLLCICWCQCCRGRRAARKQRQWEAQQYAKEGEITQPSVHLSSTRCPTMTHYSDDVEGSSAGGVNWKQQQQQYSSPSKYSDATTTSWESASNHSSSPRDVTMPDDDLATASSYLSAGGESYREQQQQHALEQQANAQYLAAVFT